MEESGPPSSDPVLVVSFSDLDRDVRKFWTAVLVRFGLTMLIDFDKKVPLVAVPKLGAAVLETDGSGDVTKKLYFFQSP